jgi:hypothetical protein
MSDKLPNPFMNLKPPNKRRPIPPKGPRNPKKHGFTNGLWRLEERKKNAKRK